jgi:hypothetical protein
VFVRAYKPADRHTASALVHPAVDGPLDAVPVGARADNREHARLNGFLEEVVGVGSPRMATPATAPAEAEEDALWRRADGKSAPADPT